MTVTILEPKQMTLYYREGSSDKIYQVSLEGTANTELFHVRFAYGPPGFHAPDRHQDRGSRGTTTRR